MQLPLLVSSTSPGSRIRCDDPEAKVMGVLMYVSSKSAVSDCQTSAIRCQTVPLSSFWAS